MKHAKDHMIPWLTRLPTPADVREHGATGSNVWLRHVPGWGLRELAACIRRNIR